MISSQLKISLFALNVAFFKGYDFFLFFCITAVEINAFLHTMYYVFMSELQLSKR